MLYFDIGEMDADISSKLTSLAFQWSAAALCFRAFVRCISMEVLASRNALRQDSALLSRGGVSDVEQILCEAAMGPAQPCARSRARLGGEEVPHRTQQSEIYLSSIKVQKPSLLLMKLAPKCDRQTRLTIRRGNEVDRAVACHGLVPN